jgi:PPOX class probable F420-dependent enzyme
VNIAVEDDHAFIRTWETSWKFKRIRNNPEVEVAPSTVSGKVTGPPTKARARVLGADEADHARKMIAQKYPILHGLFVPLNHLLLKRKTVYFEVRPLV